MKITLAAAALALCACSAQQQTQTQTGVSDAYLVTAVTAKLAVVNPDSVNMLRVSANHGVVTLRGEARSLKKETQFIDAAKSVGGVRAVRSDLKINPRAQSLKQSVSDAALTAKVSAAIAAQAGINVFKVSPHVNNGVITLTGDVPNKTIATTIVQTTSRVSGVRRVIDHLRTKP